MDLHWSPHFVGILLVSLLVFVFNSSAAELTLVSNSSSTNTVLENNISSTVLTDSSPKNENTNSSTSLTVIVDHSPRNDSSGSVDISKSFSPHDNTSTSVPPTLPKSVPSLNNTFSSVDSTSSTVSTPSPKNTSSSSIMEISNEIGDFSKNNNKTQTAIDDTVPYSIDEEVDRLKISYDEIFKFKRKCCPLNKVFAGIDHCFTAICKEIPEDAPSLFSFERHNDTSAYLRGDALQSHEPFHCDAAGQIYHYENVSILPNGSMFFYELGENIPFRDYQTFIYCLDLKPISHDSLYMVRCEEENQPQPVAYKVMKILTSIFLTGFIVVYMMKPKLHTLHNRCLMRLMICLLGKCVLSIIFHMKFSSCERVFIIQYATAAGTYFFYMASFCWSTVICYDIWSGIRLKSTKNVQRVSVQKKIRKYSLYGWGLAFFILFIAVFMDFFIAGSTDSQSDHTGALIAPEFASYCDNWMGSNEAMYVYFYGPLITLNVINVVFFVLTLVTIIQVRKDNNNVFKKSECSRRHVQAEMKWFSVFFKLYVVMGITWILDIVAFELSDPQHLSKIFSKIVVYSVDIFNICQGILIFFITIFNKETARTLSKNFSATILKARGSLTSSKKPIVTDPNTLHEEEGEGNRERASSKERSECTSV